ncbi:hypothetical protein E2562_025061 [Oryza meyeriana var. granulata]|uniref:RRM domain-containing protein n=1 Tax=Oryza meyeriana var. granulata TaxID=110450 RepID=A0A6G1D7J0_9ORYZ|nr:hypothetical protein E2562_025061 [Oryza meyeriana var. granulata]
MPSFHDAASIHGVDFVQARGPVRHLRPGASVPPTYAGPGHSGRRELTERGNGCERICTAFVAQNQEIGAIFLIDEAKSFMGLPTTHQLPQLPLLQLPSASYESPSFFYFEAQFKSSNIPSDGMSMHSLNAQAKVLGSGVPEMHNQRQSHPLGSQRDFFAQRKYRPEFRIYITIKEFSYHRRLTNQNVRDYFKYCPLSLFGPVINVYIPNEPEKRTFGFVTFQNAGTVGLVLSKGTSHSICGAEVRVKPCLPTKLEQRPSLFDCKH